MEHFDRYTSLSDERTLELLAYIRSCGGECSTVELRKVVPNYPTLKERLDWMAEDGLIEAVEQPDRRFFLGVQWHPESLFANGVDGAEEIFRAFISACEKRAGR